MSIPKDLSIISIYGVSKYSEFRVNFIFSFYGISLNIIANKNTIKIGINENIPLRLIHIIFASLEDKCYSSTLLFHNNSRTYVVSNHL